MNAQLFLKITQISNNWGHSKKKKDKSTQNQQIVVDQGEAEDDLAVKSRTEPKFSTQHYIKWVTTIQFQGLLPL